MRIAPPATTFTPRFVIFLIVVAGGSALAAVWTHKHGLPERASTFLILATTMLSFVVQWQARRRRVSPK
jgi:ADP-ribosylglycohydrolase